MCRKSGIFTGFIFLFGSLLFSQQSGEKLLKDLQTKFNTIDDLSAEFIQMTNGKKNLSGLFYYKKENKLRIDSGQMIIVSDGSESWNYNKKENKVIISNYDESDPGVFSINELVYHFPEECDVSAVTENGQAILIFKPNSYTYNFDSVKLWLDDENLISKVLISDSGLGQTEVKFSNYKLNQNFKDSEFSFIPPEGSKIIDLR